MSQEPEWNDLWRPKPVNLAGDVRGYKNVGAKATNDFMVALEELMARYYITKVDVAWAATPWAQVKETVPEPGVMLRTQADAAKAELLDNMASMASMALGYTPAEVSVAKRCPPHRWNRDGEHCLDCHQSDWMHDSGPAPDDTPPQASGG